MAQFGISKEGVSALKQLAKDMKSLNDDIEESGRTLSSTVSGMGEELGIYENEILTVIARVNTAQEKGRESIQGLSDKINKLAQKVEAIISTGL